MDVAASFSPFSFFAGLAMGVVLTLIVMRRNGAGESTHSAPTASWSATGDLEADVRSLLEAGRKIEAIKLVRQQTGSGLKEAKELVEDLERRMVRA